MQFFKKSENWENSRAKRLTDTFRFLILQTKSTWEKIKFRHFSILFAKPTFTCNDHRASRVLDLGCSIFVTACEGNRKKLWFHVTIWEDFFQLLFCCLMANFGPLSSRGSLTHPGDINHCVFTYFTSWPEGHRDWYKVWWSIGPAKHLVGCETGTFQFWLQRLEPLGHSPWISETGHFS